MNAQQAKQTAKAWVEANLEVWPGLRAAHLVGGITTMPDDAPFPAHKDVDLHLIFEEGSPALRPAGPFPTILEVSHGGLSLEAGLKSVAEYRSAEAVLANPEIAHHLTLDCVLHDPDGLLRALQEEVRRGYPRRRWVDARIQHEREGLAGALGLRPMAAGRYGSSGEAQVLGYSTTYATAVLCIAALEAPKIGGRALVRLCQDLAAHDRLDLYEELLAALGIADIGPGRVEQVVWEGAEAFDLAVAVRRTPHPFQHKLHGHLRPYFVASCQGMLAEGHHREALAWATAFHCAATDVILVDGPDGEKSRFAERRARLLGELGMETAEGRDAGFERAGRLYGAIFALADDIVANHPGIVA
jgi:hypothetical protein